MNTSLIRRVFPLAILTLGIAVASQASQIATITFDGPTTSVNDGAFYVMPYEVTIDTGSGPVTQLVTCYDTLDEVNNGDVWQANLLSLQEASTSGFFSTGSEAGYKEVAWLSTQSYADTNYQIALQHAIWSIFGSAPNNLSPVQNSYMTDYLNAAASAAAGGYAGIDFNNFVFIQQAGAVAGATGTKQALVFEGIPNNPNSATPEPGTWAMIAGGLALVVGSRRRFSRN